jgi:hypothetical protein
MLPKTNALAYQKSFMTLPLGQFPKGSSGKCYKTFYGRKLRLFLISKSVCPWLGWKGLPGTNALAYYEKSYLTVVKSFITLAPDQSSEGPVQ